MMMLGGMGDAVTVPPLATPPPSVPMFHYQPHHQTHHHHPDPYNHHHYNDTLSRHGQKIFPTKSLNIFLDSGNYTHNHTFIDADGNTQSFVHTHPYKHPHYHGDGSLYDPAIGLAHQVSGWYQINLGLVGLGALAVVAILGSRSFFPNFLVDNAGPPSFINRVDRLGDHPAAAYGTGLHRSDYDPGEGSHSADSWSDDWYNQWYSESRSNQNRVKRSPPSPGIKSVRLSDQAAENQVSWSALTEWQCKFWITCLIAQSNVSITDQNIKKISLFKLSGFTRGSGGKKSPTNEDFRVAGSAGRDCQSLKGRCPYDRRRIDKISKKILQ